VAGQPASGLASRSPLHKMSHCNVDAGIVNPAVDEFALKAAFSTLTNVNFSASAFVDYIIRSRELVNDMKARVLAVEAKPPAWCAALPYPYYCRVKYPYYC
jgi:hydroxylamine reductase (hybrid-cluster protein)